MSVTHTIRYVILNGPPGSGKTTISVELVRALRNITGNPADVVSDSFAAPLRHFFAAALAEKYGHIDKERARPELSGYSMRQSVIALGEDHCKRMYGRDCFGRWLVHRSLKYPGKRPRFVVIDDGGFPEEVDAVPNRVVIRIIRNNTSFMGDSRGFVEGQDWTLINDGDIAHTWIEVTEVAKWLVNKV